MNYRTDLIALLALFVSSAVVEYVWAGGESENLVLVVNVNSPESLAIANHYIHLRNIPASNVIYVNVSRNTESWSVQGLKPNVLKPVFEKIEERGLADHIDYIVYSAGFPTRISIQKHLKIYLEKTKQKYNIQLHAPWASINSLTYYYSNVMADDPSYFRLDANWYMRRVIKDFMKRPFTGEAQNEYEMALSRIRAGEYQQAIAMLRKLAADNPQQAVVVYQLARGLALNGDQQEAIRELENSLDAGWCYQSFVREDDAFAAMLNDSKFRAVLAKMDDLPVGMLPTQGFSNRYAWSINGWPNAQPTQGKRYMLSTVLAVTRQPGGSTLQEALNQIERSVGADGSMPRGTFYFADHRNVRSRTRKSQFRPAINQLEALGFRAELIPAAVPNNGRVLGATLGSGKIPWAKFKGEFAPGAICDNFTSYGGWFEKSNGQTPVTDYIKYGAAGASGTVYEPYTIPPKFPNAMIHAHYARGCSLAEAFYQSVHGPFQLLIVGDPLCRPFAKFPKFKVDGLTDGQDVGEFIELEMTVAPTGPGVSRFELFLDGRLGSTTVQEDNKIRINTGGISPGYHELRIVAVDDTLIASRTSKRFDFFIPDSKKQVTLGLRGTGQYKIDRTVTLNVKATVGNQVTILQNGREVGKLDDRSGEIRIDGRLLGQGKTKLVAVVKDGEQLISSIPVQLEIVP